MSKTSSSTRRLPASRPRTAQAREKTAPARPVHPAHHEITTKRRGELAELAFTYKAASLGFGVAKPHGDSERYDFILDSRELAPSYAPVGTAASAVRPERSRRNLPKLCHPERSKPMSKTNRLAQSKDLVSFSAGAPPLSRFLRQGGDFDFLSQARPTPRAFRSVATTTPAPDPPLWRVQVKCSTQLLNGLYRVNAHRRTRGRAVPYLPSEIHFLVAYIIPEDTWYVIPVRALRATSLLFRRRRDPRPGLYDAFREAWHLLRPNS
ncbi:MAG TPA: hypothetical protein VJ999_11145 [Candidatus Sulfotelmatobacter sp.]|nr:hypothetical protein [Candidatus Sulfotelmatobacter sp.]